MTRIRRLQVGGCLGLLAVALVPAGGAAQPRAYVTNELSNNVSVIDTTTNTVKTTIDVGAGPRPVEVTPNGRFVYVANHGADPNTVTVIDTSLDTAQATITVGTGPARLGFSMNSACAYAVNEGSNHVSLIDTGSMTVVGTVDTGLAPRPGAGTPDGHYGVVLNQGSNDVWVYDLTDPCNPPPPVAKIPVDINPQGALVTPDGSFLYVVGIGSDVVVIDMTNLAVLATVTVGQLAGGDISQNGHFLYVTSAVSDSIFVIDTNPGSDTFNTVIDTLHVGNGPLSGGTFRPDGTLFILANATGQLLEVDTDPQSPTYKSIVCTLPLPRLTNDDRAAITRNGATLYLTNRLSNNVIAVDISGCQVAANIAVGSNPTHVTVTPF